MREYIVRNLRNDDSDYKATHHATYVIVDGTENGEVEVNYKTTDKLGNTDETYVVSEGEVIVDTTHPTLEITSQDIESGNSSNHENIKLTFTFDEEDNFDKNDITLYLIQQIIVMHY